MVKYGKGSIWIPYTINNIEPEERGVYEEAIKQYEKLPGIEKGEVYIADDAYDFKYGNELPYLISIRVKDKNKDRSPFWKIVDEIKKKKRRIVFSFLLNLQLLNKRYL